MDRTVDHRAVHGRVLVTGGGGFLGGALVRQLVARDVEVVSFSRGHHPWLAELGVEQRRGDLADAAAVSAALAGCDEVHHVAALAGAWGPAARYRAVNVEGTRHVLAACREHGVARLVFTSSPSVVLDGRDVEGGDESLPYPARHLAPYPATKAEAERLVLAAHGDDLATVSLRPHLIWGPGDNHLLPRLVERQRAGRLRRFSGPVKRLDTIYVDDAARAQRLAARRLAEGADGVGGRPFFLSAGAPVPTWEMVDRLLAAAGEGPLRRSIPPAVARLAGAVLETVWRLARREGEPPMTRWVAQELSSSHWFDIGAARRLLGYEPRVGLDEGLERLAAWWQQREVGPG